MKLKNFKQWKTTLSAIIGGVLMVAGVIWPDKVTETVKEGVINGTGDIITGIGALITIITGLFASDN